MRGRLFSPGWLALHALTLATVATFLALGWWQLGRAAEGSLNSAVYALEWPVFAAFTVFMWWRVLRDGRHPGAPASGADQQGQAGQADHPAGADRPELPAWEDSAVRAAVVAADEREDPELARYNRYLARLDEQARAKAEGRP